MKIKILHFCIFCILVAIPYDLLAQQELDKVSVEMLKKLDFITGKWSGNGWMIGQDGIKREFSQTENIQYKIDGTALLIEGEGKSQGKTVHSAMAIVTYNKEKEAYDFRSYLFTGSSTLFTGEFINAKFYWYPSENSRFIIGLNEKGQWYETGEMKRNGDWFQFFEMTLDPIE